MAQAQNRCLIRQTGGWTYDLRICRHFASPIGKSFVQSLKIFSLGPTRLPTALRKFGTRKGEVLSYCRGAISVPRNNRMIRLFLCFVKLYKSYQLSIVSIWRSVFTYIHQACPRTACLLNISKVTLNLPCQFYYTGVLFSFQTTVAVFYIFIRSVHVTKACICKLTKE